MKTAFLVVTVYFALDVMNGLDHPPHESNFTFCSNGDAILRSRVCDGVVHCSDGSDEKYTGPGFKCHLRSKINLARRRCLLPLSMVHDDVIDCDDALDECVDSNNNFAPSKCYRCLDGEVISQTQVCDGIIDCRDLSDECTCLIRNRKGRRYGRLLKRNPICRQLSYLKPPGHIRRQARGKQKKKKKQYQCEPGKIECKTEELWNNKTKRTTNVGCITVDQLCDGKLDCPFGDDEKYCSLGNYTCSGTRQLRGNFCDGRIDCPDFDDECSPGCWLRHDYCDEVTVTQKNRTMLQCGIDNIANSTQNIATVSAYNVCNGVADCVTNNDEAHCLPSTHFYCIEKSPLFIKWTQYYDGKRDCDDGSDECQRMFNTSRDNLMRHRDALMRNPVLVAFIWIMGGMALIGNAVVVYQTSAELWKDRDAEKLGKLAKCNRVFVLNLAIADFLMGIYMIGIAVENAITDGRYCVHDRLWRSSSTCVTLGCVNQISCQTSVFMLLLMTTYRLYGTMNPFKVERSAAVNISVAACVVVWIIAIVVAVIPLTNTDYFSESIWLPLPVLQSDVVGEPSLYEFIVRINTLSHNVTGKLPDFKWTTLLNYLSVLNLTTLHPKWKARNVIPFGYYNRYPNCIPNFYPRRGDTAWGFAAAVVIFNFLAFCYITIAYIIIYKASSRPSVRKSVRKRSKQWRRDNKTMQKKIFFLIATDVACWFPICIIFALNLSRKYQARGSATDITGAVLLPINSAINPLIYSNALWKLFSLCKEKCFPKSAKNQFLPYNSFRNRFDSTSSTGMEVTRITNDFCPDQSIESLQFCDVRNRNNDVTSKAVQKKMSKRHRITRVNFSDEPSNSIPKESSQQNEDNLSDCDVTHSLLERNDHAENLLKDPSALLHLNRETIL